MISINTLSYFIANLMAALVAAGLSLSLVSLKVSLFIFFVLLVLSIFSFFLSFIVDDAGGVKSPIGAQFFIWSFSVLGIGDLYWYLKYGDKAYHDINPSHILTGVIFVSCSLVVFHLIKNIDQIGQRALKVIAFLSLVGWAYASASGISEYLEEHERVEFSILATTAAYMYCLQSLSTALFVRRIFLNIERWCGVIVSLFLLVSFVVVFLTGTREAILTFPFFCVPIGYSAFRNRIPKKYFVFSICLTAIVLSALVWSGNGRVGNIYSEMSAYSASNKSTSLGGRISMWKAGVYVFSKRPFGESVLERNTSAVEYINRNENGNPAALEAFRFHFHNEFIEVASLQGVLGVVLLFLFYIAILIVPFSGLKVDKLYLTVAFFVIVNGLTDVLVFKGGEIIFISYALVMSIFALRDSDCFSCIV